MKSKKLGAVEMKRQGAERIYRRTKKMSRTQELAFWARRSEELRSEQAKLVHPAKAKRKAG